PVLDLLVAFNDAVLMALLFFLAGLFTWRGLTHKGGAKFLGDRARRLGLPFIISAAALAPLAYYPAYLQHGGTPGFGPYVEAWRSLPVWPAGPAWFLWVLLAFSALAALSHRLAPGWGDALGQRLGPLGERPWTFYGVLVGVSALIYLPVTLVFNPMHWFELGPFTAQTSRLPFYALYFVFGIALGAYGTERGLLARDGRLAKRWMVWQGMASACLFVLLALVITVFVQLEKGTLHPAIPIAASFAFTLSCAASSLMLLSTFLRFGHWTSKAWRSLDRNAYGIYLVHYIFVNWLQLAVLDVELPAVAKAAVVFVGAAGLSWITSILLRRIPGVARVV
ncbi:MAG: acyltransferase family protein, partial [Acidobacteriota bacterium]